MRNTQQDPPPSEIHGNRRLPWGDATRSQAIGLVTAVLMLASCVPAQPEGEGSTTRWTKLVAVAGQSEPVPEQWLPDDEAKAAHEMKLPPEVAQPVPFDFAWARFKAWLPWESGVGRQYFKHLCDHEAGEWLLKKAPPQAGVYNARPMREYSTEEAQSRYDLEAPALQRSRHRSRDTIETGTYFVGDPHMPYEFVEEPRRSVDWQAHIEHPYIRLFGYRAEDKVAGRAGQPMQMIGIDRPTAPYALTWRGTKRPHDREHGVSGVEIIVFHRGSMEILGVRRQFIYAPPYDGRPDSNSWLQGEACQRLTYLSTGRETLSRLPMLVLPPVKDLEWREPELRHPVPISRR